MDFRLVPDQDPDELFASLTRLPGAERLLGRNQVQKMTMEPAARTSYTSPWAQAAIRAARRRFGVKPGHRAIQRGHRTSLRVFEALPGRRH